jgi:hypothetical protein
LTGQNLGSFFFSAKSDDQNMTGFLSSWAFWNDSLNKLDPLQKIIRKVFWAVALRPVGSVQNDSCFILKYGVNVQLHLFRRDNFLSILF